MNRVKPAEKSRYGRIYRQIWYYTYRYYLITLKKALAIGAATNVKTNAQQPNPQLIKSKARSRLRQWFRKPTSAFSRHELTKLQSRASQWQRRYENIYSAFRVYEQRKSAIFQPASATTPATSTAAKTPTAATILTQPQLTFQKL